MKKINIHFNKVKYSQSASTCTQKTEVLFLTTSFLAHTHTHRGRERKKTAQLFKACCQVRTICWRYRVVFTSRKRISNRRGREREREGLCTLTFSPNLTFIPGSVLLLFIWTVVLFVLSFVIRVLWEKMFSRIPFSYSWLHSHWKFSFCVSVQNYPSVVGRGEEWGE